MKKLIFSLMLLFGAAIAYAAAPQDLSTKIKEGSDAFLSVSYKDQNGVTNQPNYMEWSVTDESTGVVLIPKRTETPGYGTQTLNIDKCASRIINNTKDSENRLVTILFKYAGGVYTGTDYARYKLENVPDIVVTPGVTCAVGQVATPTPTNTPTS